MIVARFKLSLSHAMHTHSALGRTHQELVYSARLTRHYSEYPDNVVLGLGETEQEAVRACLAHYRSTRSAERRESAFWAAQRARPQNLTSRMYDGQGF